MGDACEAPRAVHKSEFAQLGDQLEKAEALLQQAAQGEPSARLSALAAASAELEPMGARAQVFVKRAQEKDEDKQMYGPKMVARVLDFWARLEAAVARAEELDAALAPLKALARVRHARLEPQTGLALCRYGCHTRADAYTTPLQAQAQEEEEEREEERREHEAEQARAAAAEAQRREEALVQEREAAARREAEAARRREDFEAEREHERRGQAPGAAGAALGLEEALGLLRSECAEEAALADALQALQLLCSNVVAHPEEQRFRTIRLLNANFQARRGMHHART